MQEGDWRRSEPNIWTGTIAGHEAVAIAGGMGAAAARRAVARRCPMAGPTRSSPTGGPAPSPALSSRPRRIAISEIIDHGSGERFATRIPEGMRLVTLDHVARADEKRRLAETHQAVLVDMEAAAVARLAAESEIPFYCFKGISDAYTDNLPDFSRFISPKASFACQPSWRMPRFTLRYWSSLARLGKNSSIAASNLARLLSKSQLNPVIY